MSLAFQGVFHWVRKNNFTQIGTGLSPLAQRRTVRGLMSNSLASAVCHRGPKRETAASRRSKRSQYFRALVIGLPAKCMLDFGFCVDNGTAKCLETFNQCSGRPDIPSPFCTFNRAEKLTPCPKIIARRSVDDGRNLWHRAIPCLDIDAFHFFSPFFLPIICRT